MMKGWPVLAGALSWFWGVWGPSQSHVNRISRKVLENKEPGESLRETSRTFRRELGYTSKIDVRRLGCQEDKISSKGNKSQGSVVDDAQSLRWLSVNIGCPDIPTQMAFSRRVPAKEPRQNWNALQKTPQTSGFGASKPTSFSFGNLLFILMRSFLKDQQTLSSQMWLRLGIVRGARSPQATCYLGSGRWPWTVSQEWCQCAATREDLVPSEAAVVGGRSLGMSHHPVTAMVTLIGMAFRWQWWHILLSALFTAPTLFFWVSCWQVGRDS